MFCVLGVMAVFTYLLCHCILLVHFLRANDITDIAHISTNIVKYQVYPCSLYLTMVIQSVMSMRSYHRYTWTCINNAAQTLHYERGFISTTDGEIIDYRADTIGKGMSNI